MSFLLFRSSLLEGAGGRRGPPRETDQTATLENDQLLGLQQQIMRQQDQELVQIEDAVHNTKVGGAERNWVYITLHLVFLPHYK